MKWNPFNFGGRQRFVNDAGQVLAGPDGEPVEIDPAAGDGAGSAPPGGEPGSAPEPESANESESAGEPESARTAEELAALRAENQRLAALRAENQQLRAEVARRDQEAADRAKQQIEAQARSLADRLIDGGKILPRDRAVIEETYKALAHQKPDLAAAYARQCDGGAAHGYFEERVAATGAAPAALGQPVGPAGVAMTAAAGTGPAAAPGAMALPGGRTALETTRGTETVRAGLDRASLESILAATPDGQAALAKLKTGALDWDQLVAPVAAAFGAGAAPVHR